MRNVRRFTRPFGGVATVFPLAIFYVPRSVRLCMGRLLGLRTVLYLARWVQVDKGICVSRDFHRQRRVVLNGCDKEGNLKRQLARLLRRHVRRLLSNVQVREAPFRLFDHVVVELWPRKQRFRVQDEICVQVDRVCSAVRRNQFSRRGVFLVRFVLPCRVFSTLRPGRIRRPHAIQRVDGRPTLTPFSDHLGA